MDLRRSGNWSTLDKHIGPIIHKRVWDKLRVFPGRRKDRAKKCEKPSKNGSVDMIV